MDGILALLWGIGGFVVLCCACSFWQAYRAQVTEVNFDNLHSKYSRENVDRVKEKRRRTAQEILELKEEIRIAEERLLAEHQYEQKLVSRLQQKESVRPHLKRRKNRIHKSWPPRRRTKAPRLVLEDSSSDDIEDLISARENYEPDIERGRNHSHQIRKRNFTNKRKDDTVIERVYQWLVESTPTSRRTSRTSNGVGSEKKSGRSVSIKMPKLDWAPFKKRRVNPKPKYITNQIIEKEPEFYQPKLQTEVREISLEIVANQRSPDLKLAVKSPPEKAKNSPGKNSPRRKVPKIHLKKTSNMIPQKAVAWESPISAEEDSVGLAFQSPTSKIPRQKTAAPKFQKLKMEKIQSDFSSKASLDADMGLYGDQVDDVFNAHETDFDNYSDL